MNISYRRVTPGSALSAAMALALMAQGCAPALVPMEKSELASLKDQGVIQAVTYEPPPKKEIGECREKGDLYDKLMRTPLFGALFAIPFIADLGDCFERAKDQYVDVSTLVKDRFVGETSKQLGLQTVRWIPDRLSNDELDSLRQRFGPAMVLDFKITDWELVSTPSDWSSPPRGGYQVPTTVRARLLRLSDSRILWQEACNFDVPAPKASAEAQDSSPTFGEVLWENVKRDAEACADELVSRFLSQEKHAK